MTSKPAAEPDTDSAEAEFYSVAAVEDIAKTAVRAAAHADRWPMWDAFLESMKGATVASSEFPWELPGAVSRISVKAAIKVLTATLKAVPDPAEQKRLATIIADAADRVEQEAEASGDRPAIPAGKRPVQHCSACGKPYHPRGANSRYCGSACRQRAWKARQGGEW